MTPRRNSPVRLLIVLLALFCYDALAADPTHDEADVTRVANWIDQEIDRRLNEAQVTAGPLADDAEFLRRIYLDVAGKIPPVSVVREFVADANPHKRRELVEQLLESPRFAIHFANIWTTAWLPPNENEFFHVSFENWLRLQFTENANYASIVREIIESPRDSSTANFPRPDTVMPVAFFTTRQLNPEESASAIANKFLGVRIDCAQCHDHPFDTWTRQQFKSFAALITFAPVRRGQTVAPNQNPPPAFLDGTKPNTASGAPNYLPQLGAWMTSPDNPYFARAAVNRVWQQFFGLGLVNPIDDLSEHNPPSHPQLLAGLAREFVRHDFDLKFMIRAIVASNAYQRTSKVQDGAANPELFSHMAVRGLTARQLWDSLEQASGAPIRSVPIGIIQARGANIVESEFRLLFAANENAPRDQQTTILQALSLINGQVVGAASTIDRGATLSAIRLYPGLKQNERVEALYLATVSRPPTADERSVIEAQFADSRDDAAVFGDLMWVLLNSVEFLNNH